MVGNGQRPRSARLSLILEVPFRERVLQEEPAAELDPTSPTSREEQGLLLDLSEGGFSMAHSRPIAEGHFLEFALPLKRGRSRPRLTGRVVECRAFSGNQYLIRCELRGLTPSQRNMLHQVVRLEQQNRLKVLAPVSRRSAKPQPTSAQSSI